MDDVTVPGQLPKSTLTNKISKESVEEKLAQARSSIDKLLRDPKTPEIIKLNLIASLTRSRSDDDSE